jgi:hypothetical protein
LATRQAVNAVLLSTVHNIKEFYFCGDQVFEGEKKVQVNLEPSYYILLNSQIVITALEITKSTDL